MKPKAIICDIDGTLSDMGERKPYDFENVDKDNVKHATAEAVRVFHTAGYRIILFSGREDSSKTKTAAWLKTNAIPYHDLYMRKAKDFRKDAVIKKELYEKHVKDKYKVLLVLDDRDQVVKMWREELGLTCFQVDYGDF
jgi:3-deoxy-D-manno-octulosonate 8-phosphate phosphatase KdsC-like HAD superfamily phosphatase